MVKEDELTEAKYSGKDSGMSFEKLDEKMQSWGRKKFGDRYARDLRQNELFDLADSEKARKCLNNNEKNE